MSKVKAHLPPGITEHVARDGTVLYRSRAYINGKRESFGLYPTPDEASRVRESMLDRHRGSTRGLTLRAWGVRWLDARETDGLHRATHKDRSRWDTHVLAAAFIDKPLRKIERVDVVRWLKQLVKTHATHATSYRRTGTVERRALDRTLGETTIRNALALLRRALGDAADEGLAASNVAHGVRVPKIPRTEETWTFLTAPEIADVLAPSLTPTQRAIFTVAIYTGLRPGELWGLRWADVLDREIVVRFSYRKPTKGGRVRRVPLLPQARAALDAWRRARPGIGGALVFPASGDGCHSEGFEAGFARVRRVVGIERRVRFYDLRHTCGSHLIQGTWTPEPMRLEDVQQWLGHKSRTTTEIYAHLSPDAMIARVGRMYTAPAAWDTSGTPSKH